MEWEHQRPSAPSTPSSLSSQPAGNSVAKNEKIPVLKQISPSPSVLMLSKLSDDELRRKGVEDLVRIIRRAEGDYKTLLSEHGNIVKDVNRRFQIFVLELRGLKEVNQKLQDDNQELRDLCCFLDDDRQRGRKLAREWQRFGRYTASVMRSEVAVYQEKLRELESRQTELITENVELKELCLFLDQERLRMSGDRDEGDGSSSGTITGNEDGHVAMDTNSSLTPAPGASSLSALFSSSGSVASYIRELESKVQRLEEEKKQLSRRMDATSSNWMQGALDGNSSIHQNDQSLHGSVTGPLSLRTSSVSSKPEAVVHAMKVLQVHEELEKIPYQDEDLDVPEKAIVREMCNVVWRKLGDLEDVGNLSEFSDSLLDPPFTLSSPEKNNLLPSVPGSVPSQLQMSSTPMSAPVKTVQMRNQPRPGTALQAHPYPNRADRQQSLHLFEPEHPNSQSYHLNHADSGYKGRAGSDANKSLPNERKNVEPARSAVMPPDTRNKSLYSASNVPEKPSLATQSRIYDGVRHMPQNISEQTSKLPHHSLSSVHPTSSLAPKSGHQKQFDPVPTGYWHTNQNNDSSNAPVAVMQRGPNIPVQELTNYSRFGGGDSIDNKYGYDRSADMQQKMGPKIEQYRDELGGYTGSTHFQNRGDSYTSDARNSSERDNEMKVSSRSYSSSSSLNQPVSHYPGVNNMLASSSQLNLRGPAGFRAYPPQLTSMPTRPVAWHSVNRPEESGHTNFSQDKVSNQHSNTVKKFQEQEWRQTYLDDSDTL